MEKLRQQVKKILRQRSDPLNIRRSTAEVVGQFRFVSINPEKLQSFATKIKRRIANGQLLSEDQFGARNVDIQRVFFQDVVNFCFWAPAGKQKWSIEYPPGTHVDGWNALVACFDRALEEGYPIFDATFLAGLTLETATHIFRSVDETPIPLLGERIQSLREAGDILQRDFNGQFANAVKASSYHADALSQLIISEFPSFSDSRMLNGKKVNFFKRAQICAYDISLLPDTHVDNIDQLTVFADYKLPQVFRSVGIVEYTPMLARKIDSLSLVPEGNREEIEIRAATIWVGELLADILNISPALVDNAVWLFSTQVPSKFPYHRTPTTSY